MSEDEAAVARARGGDRDAFRLLVERHSRAVYMLALRLTGNCHDAEDIVQETFLKVHRQLGRFESRASFGTWVHRIAVNCAVDLLKLIALQALQRSEPQRAAPMLEAIVRSTTAAPRLKTRALFLLARSDVAAARRVVVEVARGETSPEIQERAIDYVAARQTPVNRVLLAEVYTASSDVTIKRRVMRAFTRADDAESLVALARRETDPARKRELVQNLSLMRNKVALDYLAELAR